MSNLHEEHCSFWLSLGSLTLGIFLKIHIWELHTLATNIAGSYEIGH